MYMAARVWRYPDGCGSFYPSSLAPSAYPSPRTHPAAAAERWTKRSLGRATSKETMRDSLHVESINLLLVGGWAYPSEKHEFVNWDDEIPNIWENKKCSKPPTRLPSMRIGKLESYRVPGMETLTQKIWFGWCGELPLHLEDDRLITTQNQKWDFCEMIFDSFVIQNQSHWCLQAVPSRLLIFVSSNSLGDSCRPDFSHKWICKLCEDTWKFPGRKIANNSWQAKYPLVQ